MDLRITELIDSARDIIGRCFKPGFHHVGAAVRTRSGHIYPAVHLEAHVGRAAICAEAIAIGMAASAEDTEIELMVAVDRNGKVASPCGCCRELLYHYAPGALVVVPDEEEEAIRVMAIRELLPQKYERSA